jgi:salicylate hydroxylase
MDWKGQEISSMDFAPAAEEHGSPFYDLHRADLHKALFDRAVELGAEVLVDSHVVDVKFEADSTAAVSLRNGKILQADLVIGADGLHSRCRQYVLGRSDHPRPTGDMAYRILLDGDEVGADPELRSILEDRAVNYWYGPGSHIGEL